jgi:hypothetical protein
MSGADAAVPISQHDLEEQEAEQWCRDYDARVAAELVDPEFILIRPGGKPKSFSSNITRIISDRLVAL